MNQSSQAYALLSVAVAGLGLLARSVAHLAPKKTPVSSTSPGLPWAVDLSGPEPIAVDCFKKPVPFFGVYLV